MEEAAGPEPRSCPVPYSRIELKEPHKPALGVASSGQTMSAGLVKID
jgi:hypothetical protein